MPQGLDLGFHHIQRVQQKRRGLGTVGARVLGMRREDGTYQV